MRPRRHRLTALMLGLAALAWPASTVGQDAAGAEGQAAAPQAPEGLVVRELLVLQVSRYGDVANDPKHIPTSLIVQIPKTGRKMQSVETGPYLYAPMPVGLITFEGAPPQPMRMRVEVVEDGGGVHAHWPSDAQRGSQIIDWFEVRQAADAQQPQPLTGGGYWLAPLRESEDRLWMRTRDRLRKERFFLYDASIAYTPELALKQDDDAYRVSRVEEDQKAPPLTMLLKQSEAGWTADTAAGPWPEATARMAPGVDAQTQPQTIEDTLAPLALDLSARGYNAAEVEAAIGMVSQAGLDKSSLSLVYVLPKGQIDPHIRLRFKPEPQEVIRTTIVVLNNVDPDLESRLDKLIVELGSDDWATRDRAHRELEDLGEAAISTVQSHRDHPDPEVAFRVRQILDAYDMKIQVSK